MLHILTQLKLMIKIMAKYKSRITNKYMGSGFEGYVSSAKTTEGLELAKALQNTGERGMRIANVIK